jgi:ATP-dependent Clp protease adaptor protein ClpS
VTVAATRRGTRHGDARFSSGRARREPIASFLRLEQEPSAAKPPFTSAPSSANVGVPTMVFRPQRAFEHSPMTTHPTLMDVRPTAPHPMPATVASGPGKGNEGGDDSDRTGIVTKTRPKTKRPSLYKVLLLNDDYTPMEFVVHVLQRYFNKPREEAERIMLHVHQKGVGVCGVYTYEVAETKVTQVMDFARANHHPLQCTMEKE